MTSTAERAAALHALHTAPELLVLVNVWDVAGARAVAAVDGVRALATASAAIAAAHGFPDGEHIPLDLHLAAVERIAAATDLPLSMDMEAGYGDPGETARRAIAAGAAGGNLEDALRPLGEAVTAVAAVLRAGEAEGVPFALNARTDAVLLGGDLDDAIVRGRAYLDAGATCVFVPGVADPPAITRLVAAFGPGRLSLLAGPGAPPAAELERLGVARASIGPWGQRLALRALADAAVALLAGGALPAMRQ